MKSLMLICLLVLIQINLAHAGEGDPEYPTYEQEFNSSWFGPQMRGGLHQVLDLKKVKLAIQKHRFPPTKQTFKTEYGPIQSVQVGFGCEDNICERVTFIKSPTSPNWHALHSNQLDIGAIQDMDLTILLSSAAPAAAEA